MLVMHDLALTDDEREEMYGDVCMPSSRSAENGPKYPWETRFSLTEAILEKIKCDPSCAVVGGTVHGHFMAKITGVNINDTANGTKVRIELEMTELCLESEDAENKDT